MGFRKVIEFGKSSYVVSLPKEWVVKNRIKKGDVVTVSEEGNELKLLPYNLQPVKSAKEDFIAFDGNLKELKAKIFKSYIDDCNIITISKKGINEHASAVKKLINDNFIAMEVLQSGNDKILIKDFLNATDVSVHDLVRRMDRILMSMFEDTKDVLNGDLSKKQYIIDRDNEINKIYNLLLRILKKAMNPSDRKILELDIIDVPYYWLFITSIEGIGDLLKRMIRYVDEKTDNEIIELYDQLYEAYKKAVRGNFAKDFELCVEIMNIRKLFADKCEGLINKLGYKYYPIIERIKFIGIYSDDIAKNYIKLGRK